MTYIENKWSLWRFENIILLNEKNINYKSLSCNSNLTLEILEKYKDKGWYWGHGGISSHPNLTLEWLEKYKDKGWYWGPCGISSNPNLTLEWLEKYPDKGWDWGEFGISRNPNLTLEWLEKYPEKPWYWGECGTSCNLTLEWLEKYPDIIKYPWYWGWDGISANPFTYQKKLFIEKHEKAAFIIQKQWDICRYNPEYKICKNILTKEYEMLWNKR